MNLTGGRQQANRKSGPDYSARYPVLFSRRVVIAKSLYCLHAGLQRRYVRVSHDNKGPEFLVCPAR